MSQNLSSAAVVIGALRVNVILHIFFSAQMRFDLIPSDANDQQVLMHC